jgi:Mn2+/Fe2+ NRAMP family transporter
MPYEVYFYSSGVIEDGWKPPADIHMNRITAVLGYGLGTLLSFSLIILSAELFLPHGIDPEFLGTVALAAQSPLGQIGLLLGLGGILLAVSGAAIDTALSGAYNLTQFFGWEWGKYRRAKEAPVFTLGWIVFFLLGGLIILTGIDPVKLTEYSVIFGVVVMPLTYLPILLLASDETYMGKYVSGRFSAGLGWVYFVIIAILALTAMPLMILTNMGQG